MSDSPAVVRVLVINPQMVGRLTRALAGIGLTVTERPPIEGAQVLAYIAVPVEPLGRYVCPQCGMASANPNDAAQGYCAHCRAFTGPSAVEP